LFTNRKKAIEWLKEQLDEKSISDVYDEIVNTSGIKKGKYQVEI